MALVTVQRSPTPSATSSPCASLMSFRYSQSSLKFSEAVAQKNELIPALGKPCSALQVSCRICMKCNVPLEVRTVFVAEEEDDDDSGIGASLRTTEKYY
ncbi:hypothetical protein TURU_148640 [Turdus rufiventris]|nr:hypothetical protein TURU_148640 [Turdus rufiventris]